jgi:hypothetical protein
MIYCVGRKVETGISVISLKKIKEKRGFGDKWGYVKNEELTPLLSLSVTGSISILCHI